MSDKYNNVNGREPLHNTNQVNTPTDESKTPLARRKFLTVATAVGGAVAAVGASSLSKPAIAQSRREVRLVTTWPKGFPGLGTGAQRFADRVTQASDGKLNVKLYGAGELVPALEVHDAVSNGVAEMYHGADYYFVGKSKAYPFFTSVPMGMVASERDAWIMHGGGQELWDELSAGFGIKPLSCGNTGVQMGGWFRKEINTLDDLRGLKMRMPGLGGAVLRKLGANAVLLPGGEIFAALQSGAIDATEWVGPWNDLAFGFYKVAKYYYWPGFHEPSSTLSVGINLSFWNSLSRSEQAIITNAAIAENNYMFAEYNAKNTESLDVLINRHNVQLRQFSNSVLQEIGKASGEVMRETAESDPMAQRVFDSFVKFRRIAMRWTRLSDAAFVQMRNLPFRYD